MITRSLPLVANVVAHLRYRSLLTMAEKSALVILAPGAEEMEAVITIDVLRRAKVNVTVAGVDGVELAKCSRGVLIKPDCSLKSSKDILFDAVVLPGGAEGAKRLCESEDVKDVLKQHYKVGNIVAAICAGPTAFARHDIGKGRRITSYPSFKGELSPHYHYSENRVVKDGHMITSRGPGTAFEFALELVRQLCGQSVVDELTQQMLLQM